MSRSIDRALLAEEVMRRGAIRDRARAEATLDAVVDALANHLAAGDRTFVAERLPAPYAAAVTRPTGSAASRPGDLYAQLATSEEVSLGLAIEHARAASSALAELAGAEACALLARRLPPDWAALFKPAPVADEANSPAGTVPGHGQTLATGKPGSSHPLVEAKPSAGGK